MGLRFSGFGFRCSGELRRGGGCVGAFGVGMESAEFGTKNSGVILLGV